MDMLSGFFLLLADVFGIRLIRKEKNYAMKTAKFIVFLISGLVLAVLCYIFIGYQS